METNLNEKESKSKKISFKRVLSKTKRLITPENEASEVENPVPQSPSEDSTDPEFKEIPEEIEKSKLSLFKRKPSVLNIFSSEKGKSEDKKDHEVIEDSSGKSKEKYPEEPEEKTKDKSKIFSRQSSLLNIFSEKNGSPIYSTEEISENLENSSKKSLLTKISENFQKSAFENLADENENLEILKNLKAPNKHWFSSSGKSKNENEETSKEVEDSSDKFTEKYPEEPQEKSKDKSKIFSRQSSLLNIFSEKNAGQMDSTEEISEKLENSSKKSLLTKISENFQKSTIIENLADENENLEILKNLKAPNKHWFSSSGKSKNENEETSEKVEDSSGKVTEKCPEELQEKSKDKSKIFSRQSSLLNIFSEKNAGQGDSTEETSEKSENSSKKSLLTKISENFQKSTIIENLADENENLEILKDLKMPNKHWFSSSGKSKSENEETGEEFEFDTEGIKEGWLLNLEIFAKKGKKYKTRWFLLKPDTITWFKGPKKDILKGSLNSKDIQIADDSQSRKFILMVEGTGEKYRLMATSSELCSSWIEAFKTCDIQVIPMDQVKNEKYYGKLIPSLNFPTCSEEKIMEKESAFNSDGILENFGSVVSNVGLTASSFIPGGSLVVNAAISLTPKVFDFFRNEKVSDVQDTLDELKIQLSVKSAILAQAIGQLKSEIAALEKRYKQLSNVETSVEDRKREITTIIHNCEIISGLFSDENGVFHNNPLVMSPYLVNFAKLFLCSCEIAQDLAPHYTSEIREELGQLADVIEGYKDRAIDCRIAAICQENSVLTLVSSAAKSAVLTPAMGVFSKDGRIERRENQKVVDKLYPKNGKGYNYEYDIDDSDLCGNYKEELRTIYGLYFDNIIESLRNSCQSNNQD